VPRRWRFGHCVVYRRCAVQSHALSVGCECSRSAALSSPRARRSGKFYAAMKNLQSAVCGVRRGLHTHMFGADRVVDRRSILWMNFRHLLRERAQEKIYYKEPQGHWKNLHLHNASMRGTN
jgi:hypothetical protein